MSYPVKAIANALLQIAEEHGKAVSPLKLQKLVYIAHGWHLALTGEPLVNDELPEAWQYGPVFPSLYREFKEFGREAIKGRATEFNYDDQNSFDLIEPKIADDDDYVWELLRTVWQKYGKFSAVGLSDLTHKAGTPWDQVWSRSHGVKNADISNDVIKGHYRDLVARHKSAQKNS